MTRFDHISLLLVFGLLFVTGSAQECTLDIGGKNTETIIKIFQLNEEQIGKMEMWQGELDIKTKDIEDQIRQLMEKHPQKTPEDLTLFAKKYDALKDQMVNTSKAYDTKLIAIFNERQYQRYVDLCIEALRTPIVVPE
ncbi:MAG: hypothetical protein AAFO99_12505 [Bacteroidota bacterium]